MKLFSTINHIDPYVSTLQPQLHCHNCFEPKEKETLVEGTVLFEITELFETVVKVFKTDEGLNQNAKNLKIT